MGELVIRLDGRTLERVAYWLVIVILLVLLIFSYVGNDSPTGQVVNDSEETELAAPEPAEEPEPAEPEPVPAIEETCSDDIRNQDETNIDCGGVCTDINGEYWYNNRCNDDPEPEEPSLSGSVEFSVSNVEKKNAPGDGDTAVKVESFRVTITNGEEDDFFGSVRAYAKSVSGVSLNQFGDNLDEDTIYMGPFDIGEVESGESVTLTFSDSGAYIFQQAGYDVGDDFRLQVELVDLDGDVEEREVKTVRG